MLHFIFVMLFQLLPVVDREIRFQFLFLQKILEPNFNL